MVDKEDLNVDLGVQGSSNCQSSSVDGGGVVSSPSRKMFWRSASWSSSRTALQNTQLEEDDCAVVPRGSGAGGNGQRSRYPPMPLTPRSQHSKARSALPPLQPLAIARRSFDEWPNAGSDDLGEWPQPSTPSWNKTGERLKLDLSSIQRNADKNSGLLKRDKIAFFDKECSKVAEHVYLGGDAVAKDRSILKQNGITHILNCVGFVCPEYFKADFVYRTLWLQDSPSEDITSILYDVFDYFEDVREQSGKVFVHCCQGVSRSTSLVIAYLMWREGQSFDDAFQYVKAARGIADPNMGFACQLLQCQKRVHAFPLSPSSLLRMYRIAPHSPYDPLHLVPRMLNEPSPYCLDSRGAFVVYIPSAIYIWIGKHCNPIMERDARGSVCQFIRYERAKGPVAVIKDGEEPLYFWDAFSNYLPLMDKSVNGDDESKKVAFKECLTGRKVGAYDLDFEIFQKAIKGGVVPPFAAFENEHETHLPARESSWSALRRKFASGDVKEFVSAPKICLSRVLSDSMMHVHSPLASSSSSIPSYLSAEIVSSDPSCTQQSSFIPPPHPSSASSSSNLASSVTSNLANLSLTLPKDSFQHSPPRFEFHDTRPLPQLNKSSNILASKRLLPSIAERRGSLLKSPKLSTAGNNSNFLWYEADDSDIILESKTFDVLGNGEPHLQMYKERFNDVNESKESLKSMVHLLGCRWPSLESFSSLTARDLDSKSCVAVVSPVTNLSSEKNMVLFIWLGRSFSLDEIPVPLGNSNETDVPYCIDWSQVGQQILTHLGFSKDIPVQVIKEEEEPAEFMAFFKA